MSNPRPRPMWLEDLLESLEGWWQGIVVAVLALLLWAGFAFPWMGRLESYLILIGLPLVALGMAGLALHEVRGAALILGLAVTLVAAVAAGARIFQALLPSPALASAVMSTEARDASLEVPGNVQALRVTVHGDLEESSEQRSVPYSLILERAGVRRLARGELSRQVQQKQGFGGGPPSKSVSLHETEVHDVRLPGPGNVQLHLSAVDEKQDLRVTIAPAASGAHLLDRGLLAMIGLAAMAQALAARRQRRLPLTPLIGATAVFAVAVGRWLTPDSTLIFVIGVALLGVFAGGLGGWILGALVTRVTRVAPAEPAGPGAASGSGA